MEQGAAGGEAAQEQGHGGLGVRWMGLCGGSWGQDFLFRMKRKNQASCVVEANKSPMPCVLSQ